LFVKVRTRLTTVGTGLWLIMAGLVCPAMAADGLSLAVVAPGADHFAWESA